MRKIPFLGLLTLLVTLNPLRLWAGPKVTVGANIPAAQQVSIDQIDHAAWDALLRKYCDEQGYVNYRAWLDSTNDLQLLDQYLAQLSQANPKAAASTPAKLAFWINAYNAVTVRGILREYPTRSIRDHQSKTFGYKIWHDLLLTVGGQGYSLHQMEHEILRPMGEPRIHFAIVCASIGCPPLLNAAYTAQDLETQLTSNSKRFFADPTKFSVTAQGELRLSKILQWFPKDFGPNQAAQLQTIAPYLPTSEAQNLAKSGRARIGYLEYDWRLNDQASLRR